MAEQAKKRRKKTKIIIGVVIGVIVVIIAGFVGYNAYAHKVPEYNTSKTGVIYDKDHTDLTKQQYEGFENIAKSAITQKCSNVNIDDYSDNGMVVSKTGPTTYSITWACTKNGKSYDTTVVADIKDSSFSDNTSFTINRFISDLQITSLENNVKQGVNDLLGGND